MDQTRLVCAPDLSVQIVDISIDGSDVHIQHVGTIAALVQRVVVALNGALESKIFKLNIE